MNPEMPRGTKRNRLGLWLAGVHIVLFILSLVWVQKSNGWAWALLWPIWLVIDFPLSLLGFLPSMGLGAAIAEIRALSPVFDYVLYSPTIIHGILGTVWWAVLPKVFVRLKVNKGAT
jgi:hypothetical protein